MELRGDLGEQLVGRNADGAGEACGVPHGLLEALGELLRLAGHVGQIEVDLVDAPVLDEGCDLRHGGLERARDAAVGLVVAGEQYGVRGQGRRLHEAHARADPEDPCLVGGGGDDASAGIASQPLETFGILRSGTSAASDHHGQPLQFRVAQQLHGCKVGVHVQVSDAAGRNGARRHAYPPERICEIIAKWRTEPR